VPSVAEWRYCPRCAQPLLPEEGRVECDACGLAVYAGSAPAACALVVDERGRVLLARRAVEPDLGLWDLPGGFLEEGEHPLVGLRRELLEETALEVEPLEFFGAWPDTYGAEGSDWALNLVWTARVLGGEPRPDDDVSELRWFAADELPPPDACAFRNVAEILARWRAGEK
jgi:ADP-ribose pyrophosphatase YjhB (NUDIX family)